MENQDLKMSSQSIPSGLCNYSDSDSDDASHHKEKPFKRTFNYSTTPADGQPILMRRDVVHSKQGRKVPVSILKSSKKKLPPPEFPEQTNQTSEVEANADSVPNHEPVVTEESKLNGGAPISFVLNSTHRHNSVNVLEEVDSQKKNNSRFTQTETSLLESKKFFNLSYDLQMAKKKYSFVAVENLASVNIDSEHGWLEMLVGQLKIRDKIISELNKKVLEMKSIGSTIEMDLDYLQLKVACSEEDNDKLREQLKSSENSTELNQSTNEMPEPEPDLPSTIGFDINSIPLPEIALPPTGCSPESSNHTSIAPKQSPPKHNSTVPDTTATSESNVRTNGSIRENRPTETRRERKESGDSCVSVEMIEPPPRELKPIETVTLDEESTKEVPLEELLRLKKLEILRVHEREEAKRVAKEKERVEQQKRTLDKLKQVDAAKRKRSPSCDDAAKKNKSDTSVQSAKRFRSSSREKSRQSLSKDRKRRTNSKERKRKSVSKDRRHRSRSHNRINSPSQDRRNNRSRSKDHRKRSPSKEKRKRSSSVSKKSKSPSRNFKHKKSSTHDKKKHRSPSKESVSKKSATDPFKVHNKNVEDEVKISTKKSKKIHKKKQKKEKKSKKKSTKKSKSKESSKRAKKKRKAAFKSSSVEKEVKNGEEVTRAENDSEDSSNKLDSSDKVNGEKDSKSADSNGEHSDSSSSSSDSDSDQSSKLASNSSADKSDVVPSNSLENGKEKADVSNEDTKAKESADGVIVNQPDKEFLESQNFKFLPEFQLYFNSETGYYYDSVTRIYYDSKSCTYCYYDDVALEYRYAAKVSEAHARNFALLLHSLKEWQKKEEKDGYDSATITAQPKLKGKEESEDSAKASEKKSTEKTVENDILTYEETLRQRIASRLLERKKPSDQPPEEGKEEDVSPSTKQFEMDYAKHLEHKEMMSGGLDSASIAPSLRLMLVGFGPSSSLPKVSSVSLPPILPPTGQKNSKRIESLHLVTVDGATVGRLSKSGVHVPHISVSKEHACISYECSGASDHKYFVRDMGSNNGTYVNGKRLSATKTPSENHEIGHNWLMNIGEVQFQVHIHPGNSTCNNCEPGLTTGNAEPSSDVTENPDSEESRRATEKILRKKYGLGHHGVDNSCSDFVSSNQSYNDRAEGRRVLKGSDNPYEKTQVASIDESLHSSNKGYKLLQKMGWGEGEGLGKDSDGIKHPVEADARPVGVGLGSDGKVEKVPNSKERIRSVTRKRYDGK